MGVRHCRVFGVQKVLGEMAGLSTMGWHQRYRAIMVAGLLAWVAGHALVLNGMACVPNPPWLAWVGVGALALGVLGRCSAKWNVRFACVVLALLAGMAHAQWRLDQVPQHHIIRQFPVPMQGQAFAPEKITLVATVESLRPHPNDDTAQRAVLQIESINGKPTEGRVKLWKTTQPLPGEGTRIQATTWLRPPKTAAYPGDFDEIRVLRAEGVSAVASRLTHVSTLPVPKAGPPSLAQRVSKKLSAFQQHLTQLFYQRLPKAQGDMLAGVVLGSRAAPLDADIRDQFARTGLIHFLAASGLNVGIVAGSVLLVLRWCRLPEGVTLPLAMVAVVAYGALADWAPSVVRAGTMLVLALCLRWGFRWVKLILSPTVLFCVALAILVGWQPTLLDNLGFQLSLVTTFGILTMVPPLQQWLGRYMTPWGAGLVLVPVVAQLWVIPMIGSVFHQVAWHSVLLNIEAVACVTPLTLIGFTLAFLGVVGALVLGSVPVAMLSWLAVAAYPFATGLLQLAQWGNQWGERFPALVWQPPHLPGWWVAVYYAVLCWGAWWLHHPQSNVFAALVTVRQRVAVWLLAFTLCCVALTAWLWQQQQRGWVAVLMEDGPAASWQVLAKPPKSTLVMGLVPSKVTPWVQRTLDSLANNRVGNVTTPVPVVSVKHTQWQQWQGLRWEKQNSGDSVLTINGNHCVFKATRHYGQTQGCALVWWGKKGRAGKLWLPNAPQPSVNAMQGLHPRVVVLDWPR